MDANAEANSPAEEVTPPARKVVYVNSAQIAAAKLQMSLDRKFGRKSLDIIKKIAAAGSGPGYLFGQRLS